MRGKGRLERLRPDEIFRRVEKEGFERVWSESLSLHPKPAKRLELVFKLGTSHPLVDLLQRGRSR